MSKRNNTSGQSVTPGKHVYRGIRDPIVVDATQVSLTASPLTVSSTLANLGNSYPLSPLGFNGIQLSGSTIVGQTITTPALPFLYSTARNFQEYRVTRATFVFVSSRPPSDVGRITLGGSKDAVDTAAASQADGFVGGRQWDLSSLSSGKEARFNLPVDSVWKRVSPVCFANYSGTWIPAATVNDLCFANAFFYSTGVSSQGNLGSLYLEYDVEFRGPVSLAVNR